MSWAKQILANGGGKGRTSRSGKFSFTSYIDGIERSLNVIDKKIRAKAVLLVKRKMKKNLSKTVGSTSPRGGFPAKLTGNLRKGIGHAHNNRARNSVVGSSAPHTHLLEFGHGDGKAYNKRPFFRRTFEEEAEAVRRIMVEADV